MRNRPQAHLMATVMVAIGVQRRFLSPRKPIDNLLAFSLSHYRFAPEGKLDGR